MGRSRDVKKRALILVAAFRVFGRQGFSSATIKTIARASRVAPGSIYTYFRDKRQLFSAAVDEGWRLLLSELALLVRSEDPLDRRLDRLLDLSFQRLRESLPLVRGMLFEASRHRAFGRNLDRFGDIVVDILEEGRTRGVVRMETADWKQLVRVIMNGVLFSAAVAPEGATDEVLGAIRTSIRSLLLSRTSQGRKT